MLIAHLRRIRPALLASSLIALLACGGGGEKEVPQQACPVCPVCDVTPSPTPQDLQQQLVDKIKFIDEKAVKKFRTNPEAFQAALNQFGVTDKIGKKEIAVEEFAKMVGFFWAVDSEFRIQYLRAMMTTNRVVDMLKPAAGKFDVNIAPKDPEADDISLLVSQAIVDWAQVQRTLEDDFIGLGFENVMGVKPGDELPEAETMMKELRSMLTPAMPTPMPTAAPLPPLPGPKSAALPLLEWLEGRASAQTQSGLKGKASGGLAKPSKAVPRMRIMQAPLLLARVLSYKVGTQTFVLQSPLMAAIPEFQAIPVEQFQFPIEKMSVGPAYLDSVKAMVEELAAKPKRDMVDWWQASHGVTELRLLNQLVDYNKVAPQPAPVSTPAPSGPATGAERPNLPSGAEPRPSGAEARPSGAVPGQVPDVGAQRPSQPSGAAAPTQPTTRPEAPSGAQAPSGAAERPSAP